MTIELSENGIRDAFAEISFNRPVSRIISGAKRRQHRRRVAMSAVPAVGLVAAGGAALLTSDDLVVTNVVCFDKADLNDPNLGQVTPGNDGRSPEDVCAEVWRRGDMHPVGAPGIVPPLTACAIDHNGVGMTRGTVGVFPTDEEGFCSRPGLQPMPDGYENEVRPFAQMTDDMALAIRDAAVQEGGSEERACLTADSAVGIVAQVLRDHGYDDWTVQVGHDQEGPCRTDISFNSEAKVTTIYSTDPGTKYISINAGTAFPEDW